MYYYKQAQQLRPNDSRMIVALGETYEKMDKIENALKCYYKACNVGDIEGMALIKLAKYCIFLLWLILIFYLNLIFKLYAIDRNAFLKNKLMPYVLTYKIMLTHNKQKSSEYPIVKRES